MTNRSIARAALVTLLGFVLAACSTHVPSTPGAPVPTPDDTAPRATFAPPPTPEPTIDPQPLPSTSRFGWWEDSIQYGCHPPAYVRINGEVTALGVCPGSLDDSPSRVTVDVGQDVDIHMAVNADGAPPVYPLPEAEDPIVARSWLIWDKATMTYRALSAGTTRLMTTGSCWIKDDSPTGIHVVNGPCPVLEIQVRDIETECVDLDEDVCGGAAATAILHLYSETGSQLVSSWRVEPSSLIGAPDCGELFAIVTISIKDPVRTTKVSIGRWETNPTDLTRFTVCTY